MKQRILAATDLASRYLSALKVSWNRRHEMDPVRRTLDELAFQPAVIELIESPVSAAPQWTARFVVALFAIAIMWSAIGELDIVAVATGQVKSKGRTKVIQSMESSFVRRILVSDGQHVSRGDLLLELDAVGVTADRVGASDALLLARVNAARNAALAVAYDSGRSPLMPEVKGLSLDKISAAQRLLLAEYEVYRKKMAGLQAAVAQKNAEMRTVEEAIPPSREYARIASERVVDYESLLDKKYVSRQEYLTRVQECINAKRDVAEQENRLKELREAVRVASEELASTKSTARREALDSERQAREQASDLLAQLSKSEERSEAMRIVSPVDGTVQQLSANTVGGIVSPNVPIMSIVPSADSLEVEARVMNQDIGFVREGQAAVIKLETFPYTRYGFVTGTVASVSRDAISDEKLGLVFPVRVVLDRSSFDINGARIPLSAGMALSVEIKTGTKTVLRYFLDPLQVELTEAMRER